MKELCLLAACALALAGCSSLPCADSVHANPRPENVYTTGRSQIKLSIAPYTYCNYNFDQILDFAAQLDLRYTGVKYFQVAPRIKSNECTPANVRSITDAEIAAFKAKIAKAGMTVTSLGPVYMATREECDVAFEFAKRMGIGILVAVPYEMQGKKRVANRALCEYASTCCAKYDIKYAIHNHGPDMPELFPTGRSAYEMVEKLDPRMGLCLDIGHDFRFGYDPVDSIRRYRDRLWDVHLKNVSDCSKKGSARPFPRGRIDMVEIVKALDEIGYTGACEIEYERDFNNNLPGMSESVGYFRGLMDALR